MMKKTKTDLGCGLVLLEGFVKLIEQKERDGYFRTAANYRSAVNKLQSYDFSMSLPYTPTSYKDIPLYCPPP